jgi:TM2 domain-containing membrane protein YozV
VRQGANGQILCEQDFTAYQRVAQPFVNPQAPLAPNPALAAVLGLIPGVGAMYNGQFFKGLIHVVVFAVLISITDHYGIFGIFIAAWVFYQSFEAYHTARARRDGLPLPDPLGLNEVGNWLNLGGSHQTPPPPGGNPNVGPNPGFGANPGTGWNPVAGSESPNPAPGTGTQAPYQQVPFAPHPGFGEPPIPPIPPPYWRRREPIGAVILIGLGVIFLLNQMGYVASRIVHFSWPLVLIALGAWLIVRRSGNTKGGQQ